MLQLSHLQFRIRTSAAVLLIAGLTACGGGGSGAGSAGSSVVPPLGSASLEYQQLIAAQRELLYVPLFSKHAVEVFDAAANGNVKPLFTIKLPAPAIGVAADSRGKVYVTSGGAVYIVRDCSTLVGVIRGSKTMLQGADEVAVDAVGTVYVANESGAIGSGITEYAAGATGNVAPIRQITGPNTLLNEIIGPTGVALDSKNNVYAVVDSFPRVLEFKAGSNGNVAPIKNIFGLKTLLFTPLGIGVDAGGKIYVANNNVGAGPPPPLSTITIYGPAATGNIAPVAMIGGTNSTLENPVNVAIGRTGKIYVSDNNEVAVFAPGANGNVKPIARISGPATGLSFRDQGYIAVH